MAHNNCGVEKPLQLSSSTRMKAATVSCFRRCGIKLHFYSLGAHDKENMGRPEGKHPLWRWVFNRGAQHPCWHTILLAKSNDHTVNFQYSLVF